MSVLANQIKKHFVASSFFAVYALGWFCIYLLPFGSSHRTNLDPCARGMLMLPGIIGVIGALLGSFVYCFTLLLFTVFDQRSHRFFLVLFVLAALLPFLLLKII